MKVNCRRALHLPYLSIRERFVEADAAKVMPPPNDRGKRVDRSRAKPEVLSPIECEASNSCAVSRQVGENNELALVQRDCACGCKNRFAVCSASTSDAINPLAEIHL